MPSVSSLALALSTRSDCLLAHSGLKLPSSTYFMAISMFCPAQPASYSGSAAAARGLPRHQAAETQRVVRLRPLRSAEQPHIELAAGKQHVVKRFPDIA